MITIFPNSVKWTARPGCAVLEKHTCRSMAGWILLALFCCLANSLSAQVFNGFSYGFTDEDETAIIITDFPKTTVGPISIPASIVGKPVTVIGQGAFNQCDLLTSVTIPGSVIEIGSEAFSGCDGLASVTIPNSVTYIGSDAFSGCHGLASVTISSSVTSIGSYAFFDCTSLTSVTIPSSVTDLAGHAFDDCSSLNRVYFLGNAPSMGDTVFDEPDNSPALRLCYFDGKTGFTTPIWNVNLIPYATINLGSGTPIVDWLLQLGFSPDTNLLNDANGDGVNLLIAYALNLNPNQNLSGSLPKPVVGANQMSMSFYAGKPGVTYSVETCDNLKDWTTAGVTISAPDANQVRTATVPLGSTARFMRLMVHN
ncbi:MAG: leucine-rich repeat domain-containing protein [Luteolibacter sp.]|uniref:leucine-rich repeat domain-containing protein n=1 Tax=Luteolibacter sp. TaxID=1962973 RepID=UPI00326745CD